MATPLSDEIRALITFANETTEASDTKLGDCVKTLCEGYNGGKNIPSSPMVVPSGALSSRIAALLAYANECTGAGDTTMGDAIRTLCEGYGGGELIFYEKLVTDGVAMVVTDYVPSANIMGVYFDGHVTTWAANSTYFGVQGTNSYYVRGYHSTNTGNIYYRRFYIMLRSSAQIVGEFTQNIQDTDIQIKANWGDDAKLRCEIMSNGQTLSKEDEVTQQQMKGMTGMGVLGLNYRGTEQRYVLPSGSFVRKFEIEDAELGTLTFVPCTYNGEAGLWCLQTQTFFGNAASSGQFSVEGEIPNA